MNDCISSYIMTQETDSKLCYTKKTKAIPDTYNNLDKEYSKQLYLYENKNEVKDGSKTIKDLFCLIMLSKIIYEYIYQKLFYYVLSQGDITEDGIASNFIKIYKIYR